MKGVAPLVTWGRTPFHLSTDLYWTSVPVSEQHLLDLELEAFLSLCGEERTQARIMHMLEKGKPLRN